MKKNYILDTNVLLEDENCIEILRNGDENDVYIPLTVLDELDKLKKDSRIGLNARRATSKIAEQQEQIIFVGNELSGTSSDNRILLEILKNATNTATPSIKEIESPIFVTNDLNFKIKANYFGLTAEVYKRSNPILSESQQYTGFVEDGEELIDNCFFWKQGKLHHFTDNTIKEINYDNEIWKIRPRSTYQNATMELLLNDEIELVTIQSAAGFGKTLLSLAAALFLKNEAKRYKKIYIFRPNIEIGTPLGFLPGEIGDKMEPYFKPIRELLLKLHELRPANKLFVDPKAPKLIFNESHIELLPFNYIRGMNIEDAVVIIDECQNITRDEARAALSRLGTNVKCICTGDVMQVDHPHLDQDNNGLNWILKICKNSPNYAHIVLKGNKSRGPIADLIRIKGL